MMIQEQLKYGHSIRLQFDTVLFEELDIVRVTVDKDLILNHELLNLKSKNIQLIVKPNVDINIIDSFEGNFDFAKISMNILIGENSKVNYHIKQDINKKATLYQDYVFHLKKNAKLNLLNSILGSKQLKHKTIIYLDEEGAECNNNVAYFCKEEQKFIIETSNIHNAPHTYSFMLTKGVLDNNAKVINTGVVRIESHAYGSNGYQTGDHLLLSKTAEISPIPELEIENHDVKCSHGVTVSKINDEKMFYFTSRGIPKEQAKKMFVQGFLSPALKYLTQKNQEEILDKLK